MKDIYLKPTESGPDIKFLNGLPILTGGLDNMIYILLMTGSWWGNTTVNTKSTLTSSIPEIMATGMLTNQTRLNVISEATRVLQILLTLHRVTSKIYEWLHRDIATRGERKTFWC
jgi:hypothetical protein